MPRCHSAKCAPLAFLLAVLCPMILRSQAPQLVPSIGGSAFLAGHHLHSKASRRGTPLPQRAHVMRPSPSDARCALRLQVQRLPLAFAAQTPHANAVRLIRVVDYLQAVHANILPLFFRACSDGAVHGPGKCIRSALAACASAISSGWAAITPILVMPSSIEARRGRLSSGAPRAVVRAASHVGHRHTRSSWSRTSKPQCGHMPFAVQ